MSNKLIFQPKARLLLQLGDQLIRNESVALMEIVKNSYDANASVCRISMKDIEEPEIGVITIEDDGNGMDSNIIKNVWMQPGSDYKFKLFEKLKHIKNIKNRVPIGEKGIGRFGVHKLGYKIEIISKMNNENEIYLKIDWRDFEKDDFLKNINVNLIERKEPEYFKNNKTGTQIIIKSLRNKWTRSTVRELFRSVNSLSSPFDEQDSFKVYFTIDNIDWLSGLISFSDINKYAIYYAEAKIKNNRIEQLKYQFRPWDTMTKVKMRENIVKDVRLVEEVFDEIKKKKKWIDLDLSKYDIGIVNFKILIFDRESRILSLGVTDKKGFKDYLNLNGGIKVFRNGIRVYDYGEPDNDWLSLDIRRVNQPGKTISNNIIIGAINLDRSASTGLEEKTNREGFVENEAYSKFVTAIKFTLDKILTDRNIDKEKVRKFYSTSAHNQPVIAKLNVLYDKITKNIPKSDFQDELLRTVKEIESDFNDINKIYLKSASAGLSLSIVIHEIIHMISELSIAIEKKSVDSHIKSLVIILQKTVSDYAEVIKQSPKAKEDLKIIINQSLSNIQFRIKAHKLEIEREYLKRDNVKSLVKCSSNLVISTIINIIDNSIWWLTYANNKNKKVYIDILDEEPKGYMSILIADNGPGFSMPTEDAIKPFMSDKPGGMGLGLHLASEVMNGQNGQIIFPEDNDIEIPKEFKKGAKILLAFRK